MVGMVEEKISEIKSYAKENNVPIMMDDGIDFLTSLIRQRKVKNIFRHFAYRLSKNHAFITVKICTSSSSLMIYGIIVYI